MAAAAILNNNKSPCVGRDWCDLIEIWHSKVVQPSWRVRPLKIKKKLKSKITAAAIWKYPKLRQLDRGLSNFDKIWHYDVVRHS